MQVGREFESVEALWTMFESVMGKNPDLRKDGGEAGEGHEDGDGDHAMA